MATTRPPLVVHEHLPDQPAPPGWTARDGFDLPARPWDLGARRWVCVGAVDDAGTTDAALDALARGVGLAISIGLEGDARRRLLDDLHRLAPPAVPDTAPEVLPTEVDELIGHLAAGTTVADAAEACHVSRRTAYRMLADARERLGARTTAEVLSRWARRPRPR